MTGSAERPTIAPEMTISELLDAFPDVEETLIEMVPALANLKNPTLRNTISGLTSVRQAAEAGAVELGAMIGRLRIAAGVEEEWSGGAQPPASGTGRPAWVNDASVANTLDARAMLEAGEHPLPQVMSGIKQLEPGRVFLLVTPFTPTPLIEKARAGGNLAWSEQVGPLEFNTYFTRGD